MCVCEQQKNNRYSKIKLKIKYLLKGADVKLSEQMKIKIKSIIILLLLSVVTLGCATMPRTFLRGAAGETTIPLRSGLDFDMAFREVAFILNRHGFDLEVVQPEVGFIRTRWNHTWVMNRGAATDRYRVRVRTYFNPSRTQLIINVDAEFLRGSNWIQGFDTRAVETLRNDLNHVIGG